MSKRNSTGKDLSKVKKQPSFESYLASLPKEELLQKTIYYYNKTIELESKLRSSGNVQVRTHRNVVFPVTNVVSSASILLNPSPHGSDSSQPGPSSSPQFVISSVHHPTYQNQLMQLKQDLKKRDIEKEDLEQRYQKDQIAQIELRCDLARKDEDLQAKENERLLLDKVNQKLQAKICELRKLNNSRRDQVNYLKTRNRKKTKERKINKLGKAYHLLKNRVSKKNRLKQGIALLRQISGTKSLRLFFVDCMKELGKDEESNFIPKLTVKDAMLLAIKCGLSKRDLSLVKRVLKRCLGFDVFPSKHLLDAMEKEYAKSEYMTVRTVMEGKEMIEITELKNLKEIVSRRLTESHASGNLRVDNSTQGKIWFGILGDKGDDVTKLVGVIGNVNSANSCFNLLPLGTFTGDDTADNLLKYIPSIIEEVNQFTHVEYEENGISVVREVKQFLGGDLKFMHSMMGHRGCTLPEFCIWCKERYTRTTKISKYSRKEEELRTIADYERDFISGQNSVQQGGRIVFKLVTMDFLIPPSLHIVMGLGQRYIFDILLNFAAIADKTTDIEIGKLSQKKTKLRKLKKNIDEFELRQVPWKSDKLSLISMKTALQNQIANQVNISTDTPCSAGTSCVHRDKILSPGRKKTGTPYQCNGCDLRFHAMCIGVWNEDDRLKHEDIDEPITCFQCQGKSSTSILQIVEREIHSYEQYLADQESKLKEMKEELKMVDDILTKGQGEHREALEEAWRRHGADMCAWKQNFTGNQTHRLLQVDAIDDMFTVFEQSNSPYIDQEMRRQFPLLRQAAQHLGIIQSLCTSDFLDDGALDELETSKNMFFRFIQEAMPNETVTVKMHVLLKHVVPFSRQHRTWAKISEQSIESYHAFFSRQYRRYIAAKNPLIRLLLVFRSLLLHNQLTDNIL